MIYEVVHSRLRPEVEEEMPADRADQGFDNLPEHAAMGALIEEALSVHRSVDAEPVATDA